jgi:hypothetical protein
MICPHCIESFFPEFNVDDFSAGYPGRQTTWAISYRQICPRCEKLIVYFKAFPDQNSADLTLKRGGKIELEEKNGFVLLYPKYRNPRPVSSDIPPDYRTDFNEASDILERSPKASAALSRRLLQRLLEDKGQVKKDDLFKEIEEIISRGNMPTDITDSIHEVRAIGNFAAHPLKSTASGTIVDVEKGEAESNLDALENLFDYYFVRPAAAARRKQQTNQKLASAGKPTIK